MRRRLTLGLGVFAGAFLASLVSAVLATASLSQPVLIDSRVLSSFLTQLGYRDYTMDVRRNSSGSRLYAYQWGPEVVVIERGKVVQRLIRPGDTAYLNDQGQFVAWTDDFKSGVSFRGAKSSLPPVSSFGVDPSGRYFFASTAAATAEIGSVAKPEKILAFSKLQFPRGIFASDSKLYLVGHGSEGRRTTICETYELRSDGAYLANTQTIRDASVVLDMDVMDERLIVQGSRDFLPSVRVVQLNGSAHTGLGFATNFALFLQPGVLPQ